MDNTQGVGIRQVRDDDQAEWLRMRIKLWPEGPLEEHAAEIAGFLVRGWDAEAPWFSAAVFVAVRAAGGLCGFLEASIRPYAEDCRSWPVGYVEGWFVEPDMRRLGVGRCLLTAAEDWARGLGCREMASDTEPRNALSRAAHKALGFEECSHAVHLRKLLQTSLGSRGEVAHASVPLMLHPLEGKFAVCRLAATAPPPDWATGVGFYSLTRTADEVSIVCREEAVPDSVRHEAGWCCLRVAGSIPFTAVGILTRLTAPLTAAGISVFVASTFDTDYLFVKDTNFTRAKQVLGRQGHTIR